MISPIPAAWIGFGHNKKTGEFYLRVCGSCQDKARAIAEANSSKLRVSIELCDTHIYECSKRSSPEHD